MEEKCVHLWIIDIASGPVSAGVCERCGGQRNFRNSVGSADIKSLKKNNGSFNGR